jgi:hypothetical protein
LFGLVQSSERRAGGRNRDATQGGVNEKSVAANRENRQQKGSGGARDLGFLLCIQHVNRSFLRVAPDRIVAETFLEA